MRFILLFFFSFMSMNALLSQEMDKAEFYLEKATRIEDSAERLVYLDSICKEFHRTQAPGGLAVFEARRELVQPEENLIDGAQRTFRTTFYILRQGEMERAKKEVDTYYDRIDEIDGDSLLADIYYAKSYVEESLQNNGLALEMIEKSIALHESMRDSTTIQFGESYKAKARILQSMGRYGEASVALSTAKEVFSAVHDSIGMSDVLMSLGILYAQIGLYDESEDYFEERYRFVDPPNDVMKVMDLINLGRNVILQKDYPRAIAGYSEALAMRPYPDGYQMFGLYAYNGLIEASYFNGDDREVMEAFSEMDSVYIGMNRPEGLAFLHDQSRFFDLLVKEEYAKAEMVGEFLYAQSLEKEDASELMLHAQFLSELYRRSGEYSKALHYTDLYTDARDSMLTANKTNALLLYQTQYETKEKENEIDRLAIEKEVEKSRAQLYLGLAGMLALVLGIGGYLYFQLKRTREKVGEQNVKLRELDATKNKFFGIIGHDLSNPLVVVDAIGQRIKRQVAKKELEGVEQSADMLSKAARQLSALLDNLLKWALSQNGVMPYRPESVDVQALIEENVRQFTDIAEEKGVRLHYEVGKDDLSALVDRPSVNGLCRNLLSNAIKFTPSGGEVHIKAERSDNGVVIDFSDSGRGMDEAQLQSLFSMEMKSERGTAGEKGTGLGLVLIKELVELNRGEVTVESRKGEGTVFHILLPVA